MRLLFSTTPLDGHLRPLLPLARALRARGHSVAFATAASWRAHVEAEGFEPLAVGVDHATALAVRFDRERDAIGKLPPLDRRHYVFSYLFAEGHAPAKVPELIEVVRSWRADAVVYESADLRRRSSPPRSGLPSVNHAFGTMAPLPTIERGAQAVAPLYRRVGLEPDRYAGAFQGLYVDVVPPSLDGDRPLGESIRLRPALEPGAPSPDWLDGARAAARLCDAGHGLQHAGVVRAAPGGARSGVGRRARHRRAQRRSRGARDPPAERQGRAVRTAGDSASSLCGRDLARWLRDDSRHAGRGASPGPDPAGSQPVRERPALRADRRRSRPLPGASDRACDRLRAGRRAQ